MAYIKTSFTGGTGRGNSKNHFHSGLIHSPLGLGEELSFLEGDPELSFVDEDGVLPAMAIMKNKEDERSK